MKQIYNFEQYNPPVLNENILRTKQDRRNANVQAAILVIASILFLSVIMIFGLTALEWYPWITVLCFGYVLISVTGGGIIAVICTRKGGLTI